MMDPLWIAVIALWLVVIVEAVALVALLRQIGLLHMRVQGTGARMGNSGPPLGEKAPAVRLTTAGGETLTEVNPRGKSSLWLFVAPGCDACGELMRGARAVQQAEARSTDVYILSVDTDPDRNATFMQQHKLAPEYFANAASIEAQYRIGGTPYAVLLDKDGVTITKGLTNTLEHLESLLNARDEGFPTLEARKRHSNGSSPRPIKEQST